jgi:transposase InsO family protein
MKAEENIKALKKVLKVRSKSDLEACLFHTDTGSQYISYKQKAMLKEFKMQASMCDIAQKNAYVERVQGTLKHEYFFENKLTKENINRVAKKIMRLYNEERPHISLGYKTPVEFEKNIQQMDDKERPVLNVYKWN